MLTRKGLHYYVRQRESNDTNRRDLFGEHEGSIALGNISRIEVGTSDRREAFTFAVVCKGGGRKYTLRGSKLRPIRGLQTSPHLTVSSPAGNSHDRRLLCWRHIVAARAV